MGINIIKARPEIKPFRFGRRWAWRDCAVLGGPRQAKGYDLAQPACLTASRTGRLRPLHGLWPWCAITPAVIASPSDDRNPRAGPPGAGPITKQMQRSEGIARNTIHFRIDATARQAYLHSATRKGFDMNIAIVLVAVDARMGR